MQGSIDNVHNGKCYGWAYDDKSRTPVAVSIYIDDKLAASGIADKYRADLESAGIGNGNAAFVIDIPDSFRDGFYHAMEARSQYGASVASRNEILVVPRLTPTEFARTAPWVDSDDDTFQAELSRRLTCSEITDYIAEKLRFFRENGYVAIEQAIPHRLIDKVLDDVERAWDSPPPILVLNNALKQPVLMQDVIQSPGFRSTSFRYLDFHNVSDACAEIMMHPQVLDFVRTYLDADIAAMQTLLFENGTQQRSHQDFPYVHSLKPASLAGAWVALEDVHPDAGPLFYWPKSHRLVKTYEFEDGTVLAEGDGEHVRRYEEYLENTCREFGLEKVQFTPKKGDVLIWHSALVHGGSTRNNLALTRKSMVTHYTTRDAYPFDRRHPQTPPVTVQRHSGIYYASQRDGHQEGLYSFD
jgi:phytanoyl-CoA hydroxylase